MKISVTQDSTFQDKIHEEDLRYMLANTYTDTSFFLHALTNDSSIYTFWGDVQKNLYFISDNMRDQFGFERNIVSDLPHVWMSRIYNPIDRSRYSSDIRSIFENHRETHDMRYQVMDRDGRIFWIHCSGMIKWDKEKGIPLFFCGKVSQQDVSLLTDPVSDFAGETILLNHLNALRARGHASTCIGFCLNNISKINGVQGRTFGNRLIHNIAAELLSSCPSQMPFYRLDGMHFIAVLSDTVQTPYTEMVEKIRTIIDRNYRNMSIALNQPCSFSVMQFPKPGLSPIDFLQNLLAMLDLSNLAPDVPFLDENSEAVLQMQLRDNIELLLNKNVLEGMDQFRPVVQPVVSAVTGKIMGGETLLRWKNDSVDVSPGVFIPILEKSGLIQTAGRWVFEQAVIICTQVVPYLPDFYLSVNVSLRQLYDPTFLNFIPAVLTKYQLNGRHIVVELTESCIDQEPERVFELFDVCTKNNIRIALDDFGTGYSSMQVLLRYPLSIVKIDRSLLLEMTESQKKYNFLSSIVYACHQFGMKVCIEGVETEKQRQLSCDTGCDMIQGFFYFRPTEVDDLMKIVTEP